MEQSRVEPYVGTSGSRRAAFSDAASTSLGLDPQQRASNGHAATHRWFNGAPYDDQFTATLGADAERTFDIPITATDLSNDAESGRAAEASEQDVRVGVTLRRRYVLHRLIGTGGTCRVFLAEDLHRRMSADASGELIALKVLRQSLRHTTHSLQRLRREFLQMQQLTHPAITRVFDLDCDGDVWFMTMELVDAPSALTWMSGEYSYAEALGLILACCEAVGYAHRRGIIHGDLKPGNVLVADGGVKLIDFGSVASGSEVAATAPKLEATPQYASPSVLAGNMADVRDDIFSLGCLAYMILARGRHPFDRKPSSEAANAQLRAPYIPGIPLRLFEVIARALAWDAIERHGSVRELQQALQAVETKRSQPSTRSTQTAATNSPGEEPKYEPEPKPAPSEPPGLRDKPANTPGDYSYLSRFRGYVAGPLKDAKPPDAKLHCDAHAGVEADADEAARGEPRPGYEQVLPPEPPATLVAQQHLYMPAAVVKRAVSKHPEGKRQQRPPSRMLRIAVNVLGAALVVVSAIGAALLSRPEPKREVVASATRPLMPQPEMPIMDIPTPVMKPAPLPVMRLPRVRIASSQAVSTQAANTQALGRPERRPGASADTAATSGGPSVSFAARAVAVSPTQKLVAIPLHRSSTDEGAARVAWQIEGGRGRQLLDVTRAGNQVIQFHRGQEHRTLYVPLRKQASELAADGVRTFRVKLRQVDGGPSPGEVAEIRVTLLD